MNQHQSIGSEAGKPAGDFTEADDPFRLFAAWMTEAEAEEPNDPNAAALATVDSTGSPNVRMVLVKAADDRGFAVYSNETSAKGRELAGQGQAALCFHWKSLRRQVRIRGAVETIPADEADAYFATRPRGSQIGAWASLQSQPLRDRDALAEAVRAKKLQFGEGDVPRPPFWLGYRIVPTEIEFWLSQPSRLHDRVVFRREKEGEPWSRTRLYP